MDARQARIETMKDSERVRSLSLMLIKPSDSNGRQRPFESEGSKHSKV